MARQIAAGVKGDNALLEVKIKLIYSLLHLNRHFTCVIGILRGYTVAFDCYAKSANRDMLNAELAINNSCPDDLPVHRMKTQAPIG